jgi:maltooligosyltrehalose trehalohydrolase
MLFMGEEYGETAPFPFFVDHGDPASSRRPARVVRAEFASADWNVDVPDPADPATFRRAVLDPAIAEVEPHRSLLAMYTELLRLRRESPVVSARDAVQQVRHHDSLVIIERRLPGSDTSSAVVVNLGDHEATLALGRRCSVGFDSNDRAWGGDGQGVSIGSDGITVAAWTVALLSVSD